MIENNEFYFLIYKDVSKFNLFTKVHEKYFCNHIIRKVYFAYYKYLQGRKEIYRLKRITTKLCNLTGSEVFQYP